MECPRLSVNIGGARTREDFNFDFRIGNLALREIELHSLFLKVISYYEMRVSPSCNIATSSIIRSC